MPKVTVDPGKFERFPLKSAPKDPNDPTDEDGWIELRPLPYGMKLARRSKATRMMMRSKPATSRKEAMNQEQVVELESHDEWAINHDFSYCIGDHNLLDSQGNKIDFSKPMQVKMLDPRVGSEIEILIDKLNNDEDEESLEDLLRRSTSSLEDETITSDLDGEERTPTLVK